MSRYLVISRKSSRDDQYDFYNSWEIDIQTDKISDANELCRRNSNYDAFIVDTKNRNVRSKNTLSETDVTIHIRSFNFSE